MKGELYVVGMGPGHEGYMTYDAGAALDRAELIVGYTIYVNLLASQWFIFFLKFYLILNI